MYEREYRKLVLDGFDRKRAAGLLPPELLAPTRKDLRDHCVKVCTERYKKKDEPLLKSFYGGRNNPAEYLIAVQNADAEKFRTLNNFLKDRAKGTSFTNICMLAWMIDFEPRPFRDDLEVSIIPTSTPEPISIPTQSAPPGTPEPAPVTDDENPVDEQPLHPIPPTDGPGIKKPWVYAAVLLLLISLAAYYFFTHQDSSANEKGACMIWTGEKYQQVACSYKPEAGAVAAIPLDTTVLKRFKKITKEDTLTANSIGKVFCVKIDDKYEYYTDSAANPVYPERPLRRLTQFIMNNNP